MCGQITKFHDHLGIGVIVAENGCKRRVVLRALIQVFRSAAWRSSFCIAFADRTGRDVAARMWLNTEWAAIR
jgi:hypothetical protein